MVFNKNIFQVWLQGSQNLTVSKFKINSENWKNLNSDWNYVFVDDAKIKEACGQYSSECLQAYNEFDLLHLKVDFGRFVLLYLYGGIYVDMDMYILRPLNYSKYVNEVIKDSEKGDILAVGNIYVNIFESLVYNGSINSINNAYMISTPRNPIIKDLIDTLISRWKNSKVKYNSLTDSTEKINLITGPQFINKFFRKYIDDPSLYNVKLIPYFVFEPCDMSSNCYINDETISIHKFEMSWVSKNYKSLVLFYYNIKSYLYTFIFIILLLCIFMYIRKSLK
jgi:mannosyltransferase OCH1-like enzyme